MLDTLKQQLANVDLGWLIAVLLFCFILFLTFREALTWYWKINKVLNLLERIELTLEGIEHDLKFTKGKIKEREEKELEEVGKIHDGIRKTILAKH